MDKSKNLYGHLFALTANVMWGLMSPIGKSALQEFSPISVSTEMRLLHFYLRCGRGRGLAVVRREDDYIVSQCLPQHLSLSFIKCLL